MENLTRNTKLYKIKYTLNKKQNEVYYRDINALEYSFLCNLKNGVIVNDLAAKSVIVFTDPETIPFGTRQLIGKDVITKTNDVIQSKQLFEITVNEFREKLNHDDIMVAIKNILTCIPGQSFTDLIKLNFKDLLELVCLCEYIIGKPILDIGKKRGLINKNSLPDNGKSLQEKMNGLNSSIGVPK